MNSFHSSSKFNDPIELPNTIPLSKIKPDKIDLEIMKSSVSEPQIKVGKIDPVSLEKIRWDNDETQSMRSSKILEPVEYEKTPNFASFKGNYRYTADPSIGRDDSFGVKPRTDNLDYERLKRENEELKSMIFMKDNEIANSKLNFNRASDEKKSLRNQLLELQLQIERKNKRIEELDELEGERSLLSSEMERIKGEILAQKEENQSIHMKLDKKRDKKRILKEEIANTMRERNFLNAQVATKDSEIEKLRNRISELSAHNEILSDKVSKGKDEGEFLKLVSELDEQADAIRDLKKEISVLKDKLHETNKKNLDFEKENKDLKSKISNIEKDKMKMIESNEKIKKIRKENDELKDYNENLQSNIKAYDQEIEDYKGIIEELENEISNLKETIQQKEAEIESLQENTEEIAQLEKEHEELVTTIQEDKVYYENEISSLQKKIKEISQERDNLQIENSTKKLQYDILKEEYSKRKISSFVQTDENSEIYSEKIINLQEQKENLFIENKRLHEALEEANFEIDNYKSKFASINENPAPHNEENYLTKLYTQEKLKLSFSRNSENFESENGKTQQEKLNELQNEIAEKDSEISRLKRNLQQYSGIKEKIEELCEKQDFHNKTRSQIDSLLRKNLETENDKTHKSWNSYKRPNLEIDINNDTNSTVSFFTPTERNRKILGTSKPQEIQLLSTIFLLHTIIHFQEEKLKFQDNPRLILENEDLKKQVSLLSRANFDYQNDQNINIPTRALELKIEELSRVNYYKQREVDVLRNELKNSKELLAETNKMREEISKTLMYKLEKIYNENKRSISPIRVNGSRHLKNEYSLSELYNLQRKSYQDELEKRESEIKELNRILGNKNLYTH